MKKINKVITEISEIKTTFASNYEPEEEDEKGQRWTAPKKRHQWQHQHNMETHLPPGKFTKV